MARSRNIKPALFTNDELSEIEPLGRLLFIGLWTIADYKGDLIWREKRIKAQLLPYDDCDIKNIVINLDKSGFIRFYSDGDSIYINITNFIKHQNPHKNEREKGSDIPDYSENMRQAIDLQGLVINRDKSRLNREDSHTNRADSLNLIPDSLNLIPEYNGDSNETPLEKLLREGFNFFWECWRECKKSIGVKNSSPKEDTYQKKWKTLFNKAYFDKHGEAGFRAEVNTMCDFARYAHSKEMFDENGFNKFANMETGKFFTQKQWRDS